MRRLTNCFFILAFYFGLLYNSIMKKFKFAYSAIVAILLFLIAAASVGAIVWNVFSIIDAYKNTVSPLSFYITAIVNLSLIVLCLWVFFGGFYVIDKNGVTLKIGPIKTFTAHNDIISLLYFEKNDKLFIYSAKRGISAIVIKRDKYDEFVSAIKTFNPSVKYETVLKEDSFV